MADESVGLQRHASGVLIDGDTGEILEWPEGLGGDRTEWLMAQHVNATEQEKAWKIEKGTWGRGLELILEESEQRGYAGTEFKVNRVNASVTRYVTGERVRELLYDGTLNQEQVDALNEEGVSRYNVATVERLRDGDEPVLTRSEASAMISTSDRKGYVKTTRIVRESTMKAEERKTEDEG